MLTGFQATLMMVGQGSLAIASFAYGYARRHPTLGFYYDKILGLSLAIAAACLAWCSILFLFLTRTMHRPGVISTAALAGALLAGIAFLDPAMAGGVRPKFAEPLKDQPDEFLVYRGFPNPVTEKGLYEAEIKKDTQILPNGAAIAVKTFSSFDETFYRQPLEISGKDGIRIQKILGQCTPAFDSENPLARGKYPYQANFKIFYAQAGYGYNVHIYVPLKAILLYRSNGSGSPLRLNDRLFQELIAILSK